MLNNTNNGPLFLPDTSLTVPQNIIPMVIETSPRGERAFDIYSLLLRESCLLYTSDAADE